MDIIQYGNLIHILSILLLLALTILTLLILKNRQDKTKKTVIFILMFLNLIQHLLKSYVWYPLYHGQGFTIISTAYNMCALLIIMSPLLFFTNLKPLKEATAYFGVFSGLLSIAVPYWFIGKSILTWEYLRFYTCHTLLFMTSILSFLIFKPKFKNFFFYGLIFIFFEFLISLNNGLYRYYVYKQDYKTLLEALYNGNPVWSMHPPKEFPLYGKIIDTIVPSFIRMKNETQYRPILYNAIPLYIIITFFGLVGNSLLSDRKAERYLNAHKQKYRGKEITSGNVFIR